MFEKFESIDQPLYDTDYLTTDKDSTFFFTRALTMKGKRKGIGFTNYAPGAMPPKQKFVITGFGGKIPALIQQNYLSEIGFTLFIGSTEYFNYPLTDILFQEYKLSKPLLILPGQNFMVKVSSPVKFQHEVLLTVYLFGELFREIM